MFYKKLMIENLASLILHGKWVQKNLWPYACEKKIAFWQFLVQY